MVLNLQNDFQNKEWITEYNVKWVVIYKRASSNCFLCAPLLVPRRSGCAFLFFPICFQQVKNRKACHILLVTVFAGISYKNILRIVYGFIAVNVVCKNCASLRSSGTQNVTKKWPLN